MCAREMTLQMTEFQIEYLDGSYNRFKTIVRTNSGNNSSEKFPQVFFLVKHLEGMLLKTAAIYSCTDVKSSSESKTLPPVPMCSVVEIRQLRYNNGLTGSRD